jgi:hypothetical protein
MTMNNSSIQPLKDAVTVAEMARMVGLSRARFYQLVGSAFPFPLYQVATKRPFFNADLQQVCLEVRRRNSGMDGKAIMFYARRGGSELPRAKKRRSSTSGKPTAPLAHVLESVHALGLTSAKQNDVDASVRKLFPSGWETVAEGELIRAVFVDLKRQNSNDNVAR